MPILLHTNTKAYTIRCDTILYLPNHTIPYYTILYYTLLYSTLLYSTLLYHTILYYAILCYTILYYTTDNIHILHNSLVVV